MPKPVAGNEKTELSQAIGVRFIKGHIFVYTKDSREKFI